MALKKSQLYSKLWQSCDELRGGMDASQYKDYVLTLLFVKYVSDKYAADPAALIEVPPGARFADMVAAKGDKEIGDRINKIIGKLAEANDSLKGAINVADFNDEEKLGKGKEMVDRLSKLVAIFEGLDFGRNRAEGDDLLGDAYEYLMRHFATESGKSKGQFYTPAEVSRVMAQVIGLDKATSATQTIYDPTCGSGSLLLKGHDLAKSRTGHDLTIYGQEMDNATSALARMNMVLHDCPTAEIWPANSLSSPHFKDERNALRLKAFDYVVANPPFSQKNWTSGLDPANDLYGRFGTNPHDWGVPPPKNGDYAFLLHILTSLKSTGRGAVILPHGVLFRGGAEGAIRKKLVQQGVILALVGLPANLFYGTGIPACIVVLDKAGAPGRRGIFMIDASKGYIKDGNKNRLRAQDMHRIVDIFHRQLEQPRYSRMVPVAEIEANDFNLNLPRYIDTSEPEDLQDIDAHLKGGIPDRDLDALSDYWRVLPGVRAQLFESAGRPGYSRLLVEPSQVKATIFGHPEFTAFRQQVQARFEAWRTAQRPGLVLLKPGDSPKHLIEALSEALLAAFQGAPLLDAYDVYQRLMDYWDETMNDDAWAIALDGWQAMADGKPNFELIPEQLVVARYFAKEQAQVDALEAERDAVTLELEELIEEHGADDGPLDEAKNDKGKVTGKGVKDRLRDIRGDKDADEERALLEKLQALFDKEAAASKRLKDALKALGTKVVARYQQLDSTEMRTLVVDDKWLSALHDLLGKELGRVGQILSSRLAQLAARYSMAMPTLVRGFEELSSRVDGHLKQMGFSKPIDDARGSAIQELVAGRVRIQGFSEPWVPRRLDSLGSFLKGRGVMRDQANSGSIACVRYGEIYTTHHDIVRGFTSWISPEVAYTATRLKKGDILFAGSGETKEEIGKCVAFVDDCEAYAGGDIVILRPRGVDSRFLGYALNSPEVNRQKANFGQGDAVVHISATALGSVTVLLPPLDEQSAIADVLSTLDADLAALDALSDKTRELRHGMMQALLTGRIRLV